MNDVQSIRAALTAAALVLAACGGGDDTTADDGEVTAGSEEPHARGDHHGDHAHPHGDEQRAGHQHRMAETQERFHDVFAPIWHSDPGPERAAQACDAASQIQDLGISAAGAAIEGVEAPAEDDEAYGDYDDAMNLSTEMESATRLLVVDGCGGDAPDVEIVDRTLGRIHDIFHRSMEAWQRFHAQ